MPIPLIFGAIAVATGLTGAAKGVKGIIDTNEAKEIQESAERKLRNAQNSINKVKDETNQSIQDLGKLKLEVYSRDIRSFVDNFSKIKNIQLTDSVALDELSKLNISNQSIAEMKQTALKATSVLGSGVTGIGAGVLLGWGTYGGVMALGTASTGTAIAGLSGAAATNATLAWLGGGALAAGGGGMALGTAVLGGIIAGPALLIAGGIFGAKAKEKLDNAYSNMAEVKKIVAEIEVAEEQLSSIDANANQLYSLLKKLSSVLEKANYALERIVVNETEWSKYSQSEKYLVVAAMKTAQAVKTVLDVPLLTEDGVLTQDVRNVLNDNDVLKLAEG